MNLSHLYLAPPEKDQCWPPCPLGDEPERRALRRDFSRIGFALLLFVLVGQGMGALLVFAAMTFFPALTSHFSSSIFWNMLFSDVAFYLCALPLTLLIIRKVPEGPARIGVRYSRSQTLGLFLISYALMYLGNLLSTLINNFLTRSAGADVQSPVDLIQSDGNLFSLLIFMVIISPVMEEFLFRGVLLSRLRGYGDGFAILTGGLFFGLFHMNLAQFLYAFLLGCLFSYLALRTGTIRLTILLHSAVNFTGSVLPVMALKAGQGATVALGFGVVVCVIAGVVLLFSNSRHTVLCQSVSGLGQKRVAALFYSSPGVLCCLAFCLGLIFFTTFVI